MSKNADFIIGFTKSLANKINLDKNVDHMGARAHKCIKHCPNRKKALIKRPAIKKKRVTNLINVVFL